MKNAKTFNIINWLLGLIFCSLGIALCTKGNFGLSMISAPPYILSQWIGTALPWFTQGTAEYVWEGIILIATCIIIRHFEWKYLLAFLAAVLTGFCIDFWLMILGNSSIYDVLTVRIIVYLVGMVTISFSIACYFETTGPLQVYEVSVIEIAKKINVDKIKVKRIFDITMFAITLVLTILCVIFAGGDFTNFFGTNGPTLFGIGTILTTLVNAPLIGFFNRLIRKVEKLDN